MPKHAPTPAALKRQARAMFKPELAAEIMAPVEAQAAGPRPLSIGTLWQGDRLYKRLGVGRYEGRLSVIWNGMDSFIYQPDPEQPFAYITADGQRIQPGLMDTDGGSIPRILRGHQKFSSWGYAPAFIIHDWLFTAHKCEYEPDKQWTFPQSATLMAEAIKTLMEGGYANYEGNTQRLPKAEDTLWLMYQAVSSSFAKKLWKDRSSLVCRVKAA